MNDSLTNLGILGDDAMTAVGRPPGHPQGYINVLVSRRPRRNSTFLSEFN
jgi:hypothetical protein